MIRMKMKEQEEDEIKQRVKKNSKKIRNTRYEKEENKEKN